MADARAVAQAQEFFNSLPAHIPRPDSEAIFSPQEARQKAHKIRNELFACCAWGNHPKTLEEGNSDIHPQYALLNDIQRPAIKRKQLLQEIDPKLPKEHAPEVSALRGDEPSVRQANTNDFMLPYLNLEDLSLHNGSQFLGLLHARVHHSPSEFAWFDSDTLNFGIAAGVMKRSHGLDCAMIAFGDETTYGKVLEYSDSLDKEDRTSPDGAVMEHILRESMSLGDGLAVLELQNQLMHFLLAVVSKILIDLDLTDPKPATPLLAPEITLIDTTFQWQSSARANALRPYSPPPVFSIDEIALLLESQYELAVQHLADLRTDLMYLAETIQSYCDHRSDAIVGKAPSVLIQNRAVSLMLSDAYSFLAPVLIQIDSFIMWRGLLLMSFAPFRQDSPMVFPELATSRRSTPPNILLVFCSERRPHRDLDGFCLCKNDVKFTRKPGDKLYTFMLILLQEQETHLWKVARIFDQLDRTTRDPVEHQRISPLIASLLSQWGVVNDCKTILDWHRSAVEASEELQQGVQQRLQKWHPLLASIISGAVQATDLAGKAFPLSRFMYPKGTRNPEWAFKCKRVDDAFAAFWTAADRPPAQMCGKDLFALGTRVVAPSAVEPTDWVALGAPKVPTGRRKPTPAALMPFGGAAQTSVAREAVPAVKAKPKTRGVAAIGPEDIDRAPEVPENLGAPVPTRMAVSAKAYKVFSLFNAVKDEEIVLQQGSVPWKDIQTAFAQLDFGGPRIGVDVPSPRWTAESLTVHEPHPEPTMRFWEARRFGRRLTRTLFMRSGGGEGTFVNNTKPRQPRLLHSLMSSRQTSALVHANSFHPTLLITVEVLDIEPCSLHVYCASVFIDPYELGSYHRSYAFHHIGSSNLELPAAALEEPGSSLLLSIPPLSTGTIEIEVPLHSIRVLSDYRAAMAYRFSLLPQFPSVISLFAIALLYSADIDLVPHEFSSAPVPTEFKQAFNSSVSTIIPIPFHGPTSVCVIQTPVGLRDDIAVVEVGTAAVIALSFFYLLNAILRTVRRISHPASFKADQRVRIHIVVAFCDSA
ncbi:hypothetical protein FB451DRAFT_1473261 [Mycena latifolia]|nr:hypothetical protein FB451DRAFT_1473261 [Mycena latifolia]